MISGVLLDLAGVIYDGDEAIPGAVEAVEPLRASGLPLRFVSNTTRSTNRRIIERLARFGLTVPEAELFTPARAAREWLIEHNRQPHLLIHPGLAGEFAGLPEEGEPAVVIGDAGDALDYAALNGAFRKLVEGADFLALAYNRAFKDSDGKLSLDAGPFVAALEFASLRPALVLGKPSADFFLAALAGMDCPPGHAVMVGDDAESDVAGALRAGLAYALQVRTGKYRAGDETRFEPHPTAVVDDLAAAVDWIIARNV